jgi:hypothetical protein
MSHGTAVADERKESLRKNYLAAIVGEVRSERTGVFSREDHAVYVSERKCDVAQDSPFSFHVEVVLVGLR